MVEQDLIISRALIELFSDTFLKERFVFRGGTALHKLFFPEPLRYSEDIDLVQRTEEPIGPVFDRIREVLSGWLGDKPRRSQGPGVVNLVYRMEAEANPDQVLKMKIEINSREHFNVLPLESRRISLSSRWWSGSADVPVYALEELLGTKLRALYQRRKGRDLFDQATALRELTPNPKQILDIFSRYMKEQGQHVTREQFRQNLEAKLGHPGFLSDCEPLLRAGVVLDLKQDAELVSRLLIDGMPDEV